MATQALALKYRPKSFDDLTEQTAVVKILTNQIETNTIKHGYLFVGSAGTGKTTSARIFADMINNGQGTPIELDAASNNGVDDIRNLIEEAQTKSLDGEYKVLIIDECHMITTQGWNAFLKTLEEPPEKSIFIMCTTDPQKIPNTILSRVQRYNFQKISTEGIVKRLFYILKNEFPSTISQNDIGTTVEPGAVEYIARLANGGMRDGITLLDKCLSYSKELTVDNIVKALGIADYDTLCNIVECFRDNNTIKLVDEIDKVFNSGADLKQFIKMFFEFVLDLNVLSITGYDYSLVKIPKSFNDRINKWEDKNYYQLQTGLLKMLLELQNDIKYEGNPKAIILAKFLLFEV